MDDLEGEDRRLNQSSSYSFPDFFLSSLGRTEPVVIWFCPPTLHGSCPLRWCGWGGIPYGYCYSQDTPISLVVKLSGVSQENASNCKVLQNTLNFSNVASFPPKYVKHLKGSINHKVSLFRNINFSQRSKSGENKWKPKEKTIARNHGLWSYHNTRIIPI
jgi:hypothetical protein